MEQCEVCGQDTERCPPSPFLPCSYWKCDDCRKGHRVKYNELLCVLCGTGTANSFDDRINELNSLLSTDRAPKYGARWLLPTLEFFGKTKEEAWSEKENWKKYDTNKRTT